MPGMHDRGQDRLRPSTDAVTWPRDSLSADKLVGAHAIRIQLVGIFRVKEVLVHQDRILNG